MVKARPKNKLMMDKDKWQSKKTKYRDVWHEYLRDEIKMLAYQKVGIAFLIWVIAGFVGWVYEAIVDLVSTGRFYMEGGNLLPWMNIYAIGALVVVPATYKFRKHPWAVFLVAALVTGIVELVGGWLVYTVGNGTRYWNYDSGLWAVGSINGFVCPLSVTFFGIGSLLLMYVVLPFCMYLAKRMSRRAFLALAIALFAVVMVDELTNLILKNLDKPTAMDFYRWIGLKYK